MVLLILTLLRRCVCMSAILQENARVLAEKEAALQQAQAEAEQARRTYDNVVAQLSGARARSTSLSPLRQPQQHGYESDDESVEDPWENAVDAALAEDIAPIEFRPGKDDESDVVALAPPQHRRRSVSPKKARRFGKASTGGHAGRAQSPAAVPVGFPRLPRLAGSPRPRPASDQLLRFF